MNNKEEAYSKTIISNYSPSNLHNVIFYPEIYHSCLWRWNVTMSFTKKSLSVLMCIVICLVSFPFEKVAIEAHAICCRKDGFDKSRYTLTGNMAEDVATIAKSQKGRFCDDFGYSGVDWGAWCDEFVADCIENAGADSSIVAHGGTVADFANKMRARGAIQVSTPQTGDLVFFTYSHVEIVTKVVNGVVYSAGGNNDDPDAGYTYHDGGCIRIIIVAASRINNTINNLSDYFDMRVCEEY